ncbi:hypothetical protein RB653_006819 [Dictyostelium firmibasis]|uniref:Armadillo repeat-containing protein 1 n=1 Tax=Dictyostelium firmibasis TaxID=79012 RepID=A0AAN7YNG0_9MYCE
MSALSIVQSLHKLSQDVDNREHIVKDQGCLAVLVMLLGSNEEESEMVLLCLETLELLSQNQNNKQPMLKEPGLVSTLKKLQQKDQYKSVVDKILINIEGSNYDRGTINETTKIDPNNIQPPMDEASNNTSTSYSTVPKKSASTSFSMLIGEKLPIKDTPVKTNTINSASQVNGGKSIDPSLIKTLLLHVKGMNNESTKKQLEECLLKTKGVISFMIDLTQCHATVRTSLSSDEIKLVIRNNVGLSASLIIDGQEEVESTPDYLPEPYNPNNSNSSKRWGWGSIISFGAQEQKQKQEGNWGWNSFSKVLFG